MSFKIPWWNVDLGQEAAEAVAEAVRGRNVSMGRLAEEFENQMAARLEVPHVVAVTNGSMALTAALMELGIGPGDEVIVPAMTWVATAHAAFMLGAKVVLADIAADCPVIDPEAAERAVTSRSKAIIPVHWNGRACDMDALRKLAEARGLALIEDAAQALFCTDSQGRRLGTMGRCGCFSLAMNKLLTSGQGGFIATADSEVNRRLRLIRLHGVASVMLPEWDLPGSNFRYTDVLAAIGLSQLKKWRQRLEGVWRTYAIYADNLTDSEVFRLHRPSGPGQVPVSVEAETPDPQGLTAFLKSRGIEARPMYAPLYKVPHLAQDGPYPNADRYAGRAIFLPGGPDRSEEELMLVVEALRQWTARS